MNDETTIVRDSFSRSIAKDIIGHFYDIFLKSHPDIAPHFVNTDFTAQKHLLQHGINLAIMYAEGKSFGTSGIKRIRKSHSKSGMDIEPRLYPYWKASFLKAISETDPKYDKQIHNAWDSVLQKTIDYIIEGYEET